MNGKENIINKILTDADNTCAEILQSAEKQAEQIKADAERAMEAEMQALSARIEALSAERIRNRIATAELDARKYRLNEKQRVIGKCYDNALDKLANLPAKDKQSFVIGLLKKYAEQGEFVRVAKADKDVITQKVLDEAGKKLVLSKTYHDERGGVILEGNGYDKDLTLPRIIDSLREQTEGAVARVLFGE